MRKRRDQHYESLFMAMSEGFALCESILDDSGKLVDYLILEINPALQAMLGVGPEVAGTTLSDGPPTGRRWLAVCDEVFRTGEPMSFEVHNQESGRWHEIRLNRVAPNQMAQFFFDITDRKAAADRQAELFDELNHRVKNNLAMVSSLLALQARGAGPTTRNHLMKAVDRLASVSAVHESLYSGHRTEDVDFGGYLQGLCARLSDSLLEGERVRIEVTATGELVSIDHAAPLGMIVNELVTNAAKYAYPQPQSGVIQVRFGRDDQGLFLSISDTGVGMPKGRGGRSTGLGMKVVTSLVQQVGGVLTVQAPPGTRFDIRLASADGS